MPFKVTARTLLHLGAELISSDAIAFYELIKNAFDAGSKRVEISVVVRIPYETVSEIRNLLEEQGVSKKEVQSRIRKKIDFSAPKAKLLEHKIVNARSRVDFIKILDEANYIIIRDTGEGMSLDDLNEIYLTIGTRSRLKQREEQKKSRSESSRPILGEKGVGRLSVMRLGRQLKVTTSKKNEQRWNLLEIDWTQFSHESDALLEEVKVSPQLGEFKEDSEVSGTTLYITGLTSAWNNDKLVDIAQQEFSKLTDPFIPISRYPIIVRFNGDLVNIGRLDKIIFEWAHATVNAEFFFDDQDKPHLEGTTDYRLRRRKKTFSYHGTHLISFAKVSSYTTFKSLGPFKMRLYWYNRRLLTAIEGIGDQRRVRELVADWAGGLMVYRDGFRVNPYGGSDDDWLDLDQKALASGGYKVNRRQIIGKVDISARRNPHLIDQTNREGLTNSDEKEALISLLRFIIIEEFKNFLDTVDKEVQSREPVNFDDLVERVEVQEKEVQDNLQLLLEKYPQLKEDNQFIPVIRETTSKIREWMREAEQLAESYERGRTQLLNLAGLGLMVEILAHELNRATVYTLATLADADIGSLSSDVKSLFSTLESQLKTLQKRLRILDPLSTSGRQVKETFDLIAWVQEILSSHQAQFQRHGIRYSLRVEPDRPNPTLSIKAVKGMIVQILENLISNSVYWFKQERIRNRSFVPEITITIYTRTKELHFTDNGPGVDPKMKEDIFQPFMTTKPPGEGKGLGLFISREIANHHGAVLYLSDQPTVHPDTLNTFVFALEGKDS